MTQTYDDIFNSFHLEGKVTEVHAEEIKEILRSVLSPKVQTHDEVIEKLSAEIHKLYCVQHEKDYGEPYWTNGDYSLLEERVKEYDRNIARWHLSALSQQEHRIEEKWKDRIREAIGEQINQPESTFVAGIDEYIWHENNGRNQEKSRLRTTLLEEGRK